MHFEQVKSRLGSKSHRSKRGAESASVFFFRFTFMIKLFIERLLYTQISFEGNTKTLALGVVSVQM